MTQRDHAAATDPAPAKLSPARRLKKTSVAAAARVVPWLLRGWLAFVRLTSGVSIDKAGRRALADAAAGKDCIVVSLHQGLLYLAFFFAGSRMHTLVSIGDIGDVIAGLCRLYGYSALRGGSSSRASRRRPAVDYLLEAVAETRDTGTCTYITPDGSRGPAGACKVGFAVVAARTGLPVYAVCGSSRRCWYAPGWDRFALPLPFSRVSLEALGPFTAGNEDNAAELLRVEVEQALHTLHARAFERMDKPQTPGLQTLQVEEATGEKSDG
jgi:lysophospholipid acyltransferase (LPLAT)-like uncharacterized protein